MYSIWFRRFSAPVLAAFVVASAGDAVAAKKKAKTVTTTSEETPATEEEKKPELNPFAQSPTSDKYTEKAAEKRKEAINTLEAILKDIPAQAPQRPELIFRLAELYWEHSKYLYFKEFEQFNAEYAKWADGGRKSKEPKLQSFIGESEAWKKQALRNYDVIIQKYPDYERRDEVLFIMAQNKYESGDKKGAIELYWTLIKQFPQSTYVGDSYLAMGEHFFASNDLKKAIKAYEKALETNKPKIYSFALYRLAWCDYNQQAFVEALEKFKRVIDHAEKQAEESWEQRDRIQLRGEAINDTIQVFAHLDAVDEVYEFVKQKQSDRTEKLMQKLSNVYIEQGKHYLSIKTLQLMNNEFAYSADAPERQASIVGSFEKLNKHEDVKKEVRRLIDNYRPNSVWATKNAGNDRAIKRAYELTENALRDLVTDYHQYAQKTKARDYYVLARDIYKEYMDNFADSEFSYRMRFFYAEILYYLHEWTAAADQYDKVVDQDQKGEYSLKAAYAAILSWEKIVSGAREGDSGSRIDETANKGKTAKAEKVEKLVKSKDYKPEEIPENERRLAAACERYVNLAPKKDEELPPVMFKAAKIYYDHYQFDEAAPRFNEVIDRWPQDKLAKTAAHLVLDMFNVLAEFNNTFKRWEDLNSWARKFSKNKTLMEDATFSKELAELVEGSAFKVAAAFEAETQDPMAKAEKYLAFVNEFKTSKFADKALYNVIIFYDKANFAKGATQAAERFLAEYKESEQLPSVYDLLANFYVRIADFTNAASYFDTFADKFGKHERAGANRINAGVFWEGMGKLEKALASYKQYLKDFPKEREAAGVNWKIAAIHERKKDYVEAINTYKDLLTTYRKAITDADALDAKYKMAVALQKNGKKTDADAEFQGISKMFGSLPEAEKTKSSARLAAAQASFTLVEKAYEDYEAIKLKSSNDRKLVAEIEEKTAKLAELEKSYTAILGIGNGDYGIASLCRIGQLYQGFSKALFDAPVPKHLDDEQGEIYRAALAEKAFPLEEKAIEAYDKALAKAYELHIYNEWTKLAQDQLRSFRPQDFPEVHSYPLIAAESFYGADLVTTK